MWLWLPLTLSIHALTAFLALTGGKDLWPAPVLFSVCLRGSRGGCCYQFMTHSLFYHVLEENTALHEPPVWFLISALKAGG